MQQLLVIVDTSPILCPKQKKDLQYVSPFHNTIKYSKLFYNLEFTSKAFNSSKACVKRVTNASSPLRNHTRGS